MSDHYASILSGGRCLVKCVPEEFHWSRLKGTDMRMLRWMSGASRVESIRNIERENADHNGWAMWCKGMGFGSG